MSKLTTITYCCYFLEIPEANLWDWTLKAPYCKGGLLLRFWSCPQKISSEDHLKIFCKSPDEEHWIVQERKKEWETLNRTRKKKRKTSNKPGNCYFHMPLTIFRKLFCVQFYFNFSLQKIDVNSFHDTGLFLYPLKTSENLQISISIPPWKGQKTKRFLGV